jgi:probable phosphoglycerate mutase
LDDDAQEIRVGEADGLTHQEAWERFGRPGFEFDPYRPIAPGGENWSQFMLRVGSTIHRIIREHDGKTIVLVCHGGFIDGSFSYFLNMNTRYPLRTEFYPHNTSITHWEQYVFNSHQRWRLGSYNDIAHLRNVGFAESPRWSGEDEE